MAQRPFQKPEQVLTFLERMGIGDKSVYAVWLSKDELRVNDTPATVGTVIEAGQRLSLPGRTYDIVETAEPGRLSVTPHDTLSPVRISDKIPGKVRVQCGYHKCLTMYFRRISKKSVRWIDPLHGSFRHFFHRAEEFYADGAAYTISSVSGNYLHLDRFEDIRAVHIVRDPRDMVISGYHYHKRAAEEWTEYRDPTDSDWAIVNGAVPSGLPAGTSFSEYLNNVAEEEGLAAEIEFRRFHFENMRRWPLDDPRVLTVRYEDLMGAEAQTFKKIYAFYEFGLPSRIAAGRYAARYSSKSARKNARHIRNASAGQWQSSFTPALTERFNDLYGDLLETFGYEK